MQSISDITNTIVPECVNRDTYNTKWHCDRLDRIAYCAKNYIPYGKRSSYIARAVAQECDEWKLRDQHAAGLDWMINYNIKNIVGDLDRSVHASSAFIAAVDKYEKDRMDGVETADVLKGATSVDKPVVLPDLIPRKIEEVLPKCAEATKSPTGVVPGATPRDEPSTYVRGACGYLQRAQYCSMNYFPPEKRDSPLAKVLSYECYIHWDDVGSPARADKILSAVQTIESDQHARVTAAAEILAGFEQVEARTKTPAPPVKSSPFSWFKSGN